MIFKAAFETELAYLFFTITHILLQKPNALRDVKMTTFTRFIEQKR